MRKPIISIIIPCYNCELYIERNIKSILNQTFHEFEIIYINDGSKDKTLEILKKYEKKDSRIKVVSIENQGVSNARNEGLSRAKGKYIIFIDADDYVDNRYVEKLYNETNNESIDYVKCNMKRIESSSPMNSHRNFVCNTKEEFSIVYDLLLNTYMLNQVYASIIKKSIIDKNKIKFNQKYNYAEDLNFNIDLFSRIKNFKYIDYVGYYYCDNPESLTRKIQSEKIIRNLDAVIKIYGRFYDFNIEEQKVNRKIERELNHVLDSLFYFNTRISLKERFCIYKKTCEIICEKPDVFRSFDMKLIRYQLYIFYDIKNYILKKIPRKAKRLLTK